MLLLTFMLLTIMSLLLMITTSSPLILGVFLLMTATSLTTSIALTTSPWMACIFFIVYIGGLLIMIFYFITMSPNQKYSTNMFTMMIMWTTPAIIFLAPLVYFLKMYTTLPSSNFSLTPQILLPQISQLFTSSNFLLLPMLATILFYILIIAVKTTNRSEGPMRPFS